MVLILPYTKTMVANILKALILGAKTMIWSCWGIFVVRFPDFIEMGQVFLWAVCPHNLNEKMSHIILLFFWCNWQGEMKLETNRCEVCKRKYSCFEI